MGRSSRTKGANGERDFRNLLRRFGFACDRDGSVLGDLRHDVPGVHFEVKRCEALAIPKWLRQAEEDAGLLVPVVAFRRSREPWRVVVPAAEYLRLKAIEREATEALDSSGARTESGGAELGIAGRIRILAFDLTTTANRLRKAA